jgi:hypothetical protein
MSVTLVDGNRSGHRGLAIAGDLARPLDTTGAHLRASWSGGDAVVAALV